MRRLALPLLVAANVSLMALLAWLWLTPQGSLRDMQWVAPQPVKPSLGTAANMPSFEVDLNRYVATLERPLFTPGRRPPQPAAAAASAPPVDPFPNIRLLGVYGTQDAGGVVAVVNGKVQRVKLGASIGGWSIKELRAGEIVMARADDVRTIAVQRSVGTEPPVAAADAPGSAAATGAPAGAATAAQSYMQSERERVRLQISRMNVLRARSGLPPLPEP